MRNFPRIAVLVAVLLLLGTFIFAAGDTTTGSDPGAANTGLSVGLKAIAAALAIGLSALATAIAQARIGAAGAGAIAERPESTGMVLVMLAIPETIVIFGFIISAIIIFVL